MATAYGTDTGYQAGTGMGKHGGGTVTAIIHNAIDLPDKDWFGKQDPYCIFDVGEQRFETPAVKSGGENPYWDEQFTFNPSGVSSVKVTVYNKNRLLPDNTIGSGYVNLNTINEGGYTNVPIQDKKGSPAGTLRMSFKGLSGSSGIGEGMREQGYEGEQRSGVGGLGAGAGALGAGAGALGAGAIGMQGERQMEGTREGYSREGNMMGTGTGMATGVTTGTESLVGQEYYTKVEDRPRVVERTEYVREHRPVEHQYVTETKFVGEQELAEGRTVESLGTREEVVDPMMSSGTTTGTTTGTGMMGTGATTGTNIGSGMRGTGNTTDTY